MLDHPLSRQGLAALFAGSRRADADVEPEAVLRRIQIENFLSFRELDLTLRPLQVLVGPNGSGKTNLLEALRFLVRLIRGETLTTVYRDLGGYDSLVWKGERERRLSFVLDFDLRGSLCRYRLGCDDTSVTAEEFFVDSSIFLKADPSDPPFRIRHGDAWSELLRVPNRSSLSLVDSPHQSQWCFDARELLGSWAFHRLSPENMRPPRQVRRASRLDIDGTNLSQVLGTLVTSSREDYDSIVEQVAEWIPEIQTVNVELTENGEFYLGLREKGWSADLPARRIPDGFLGLLACLTVFKQPSRPSLVFFDEPENFVHPRLLGRLAGLLKTESSRVQVLLSTHSPYLVDRFEPEDLLIVERSDHGTCLRTPENLPMLRKALKDEFSLGEMWFSGFLGAVPEA